MSKTTLPLVGKDKIILHSFLAEGREYVNLTQSSKGTYLSFRNTCLLRDGAAPAAAAPVPGVQLYSVVCVPESRKANPSSACPILHRHGANPYRIARGRGCTAVPNNSVTFCHPHGEPLPFRSNIRVLCQAGNAANTDHTEGKPMGL